MIQCLRPGRSSTVDEITRFTLIAPSLDRDLTPIAVSRMAIDIRAIVPLVICSWCLSFGPNCTFGRVGLRPSGLT